MMGPKVIVIIFLVVALGIGLYVVQSGVIGRVGSGIESLTGKFNQASTTAEVSESSSTPIAQTPGSGAGYFESVPTPSPSAGYFTPSPPTPTPSPVVEQINPSDIPEGFTAKDLSPYFHKIRLGSVYSGSEYSDGQVSLYTNFYSASQGTGGGESINVSGWFLRARAGSQIVPQAVNVYDPSGLTAESDIYLKEGDTLNIYTGISAISKNLHLNKCLGFLENTNNFKPSLPRSCPYTERREISSFSGTCQDYVLSLGSCVLPESNPPIPENDYGCRAYLNTINYKGCFDRYRSDSDFLSREWWAWTGSRFLDERHDRLMLLDRKGLLVDLYEY